MTNNNQSSIQRSVPLPSSWKDRLRWWKPAQSLWSMYRCRQVENQYSKRREYYSKLASERNLKYSESDITMAVRNRIAGRGYTPAQRQIGEIHTFACIPMYGWHKHLLPDLHELGSVTHFDYTKLGYSLETIALSNRDGIQQRSEMVKHLVPALRTAHRKHPIDWIFFYGGGQDVSPLVLQEITEEFGIPMVNMSLDDKQGWAGPLNNECRTGAIDITSSFDLYMTSARVACEWHLAEGGHPIYLPEGFDSSSYYPSKIDADIPVSFVGAAYGSRIPIYQYLRQHGVDIRPYGNGWPQSGWVDDLVSVFNRSTINLGSGGIAYSESLTNVKGRDFEIPGTGGGVYLTSFNPDLAQHFVVGEEILCYRNRDEMLELIRYYLAHPNEAAGIAKRGRERCLREHRWLHRYTRMLEVLGILSV